MGKDAPMGSEIKREGYIVGVSFFWRQSGDTTTRKLGFYSLEHEGGVKKDGARSVRCTRNKVVLRLIPFVYHETVPVPEIPRTHECMF